jgi:D-alanyl-D-alanine carboxypeptidase
VTKTIPLADTNYEPSDLIALSGSSVEQAGRNSYLRQDAYSALDAMGRDFRKTFGKPLVVISGYRSAAYQQRLWDLGRCTDTLCAPPGYSEHQLGLAIDVFDATTASDYMRNALYKKYITWIQKNGHIYGYTQSYQR